MFMLPSCLVHANVACAYYSLASYPGHVTLLSSHSAWLNILLHHDCSDFNDHQERLNCKCMYKQLVLGKHLCTEDEVLELLRALDTS